MKEFIATFYTHFGALKFDKFCKKQGVKSAQMPVPRKLSSSCGTCVRFFAEDITFVKEAGVHEDMEGCYLVNGKDDYTSLDL